MLHRYSPRKPGIRSLEQFDMCLKTRLVQVTSIGATE